MTVIFLPGYMHLHQSTQLALFWAAFVPKFGRFIDDWTPNSSIFS